MGIVETLTNPVLNPLLRLGSFWALVIVSLLVSLLVTLIYKWVTDQEEMKRLKTELKDYQKQMKESRDSPEKLVELQKKAMGVNMQYMKHSFKPTLITFIPIILIFGWLNAHLAFMPIMPGEEFTVDVLFDEGVEGKVQVVVPPGIGVVGEKVKDVNSGVEFVLKGVQEGEYFIDIEHEGKIYSKEVVMTKKQEYAEQTKTFQGPVKSVTIRYEKLKPLGEFALFGWKPGWLGLYIIFSLVFSMGLRKVLKLH